MLDPILSEIRQIREAFADKYHGDVTVMLAALRASGEASGRKTVTLAPRRCSPPHERSRSSAASNSSPAGRVQTEPDIIHEEIVESAARSSGGMSRTTSGPD